MIFIAKYSNKKEVYCNLFIEKTWNGKFKMDFKFRLDEKILTRFAVTK